MQQQKISTGPMQPKSLINDPEKPEINKYLKYTASERISNIKRQTIEEIPVEQSKELLKSVSYIKQSNFSSQEFKSKAKKSGYIPMKCIKKVINDEIKNNPAKTVTEQRKHNFVKQDKHFVQEKQQQIFNDDDKLQQILNKQGMKAEIQVSIKAQRSQIKLGENISIPAMCSVIAKGGIRTSIDLICVIDISGSMNGNKIKLVKDTMHFLIKTLTPEDRLSIITFNQKGRRICGLKAVTQENIVILSKQIDRIIAQSGTKIMSGMQLALKTIRDRKRQNQTTSIFLLSDGQDQNAYIQLKQSLKNKQNQQLGIFTIHSFGFGQDHDENLMNRICKLKDGTFYYIKELQTLDEAFSNALGGIISSVATQAIIKVKCVSSGIVQGINIKKTYGDKWQKITQGEYVIKLTQLVSGVSKDFIFELDIPALNGIVQDTGRQHLIIELDFQAISMSKQIITDKQILSLVLINKHEEIVEINENVDVIQNYLRVQAAEAIEVSIKKAQINQFKQAQQGIKKMIFQIRSSTKARPQKVSQLLRDLEQVQQKCRKDTFEQGRKLMTSFGGSHAYQQNYQYSNPVQSVMINLARTFRGSI